mgnify:CR=1 FL=1
MCIRGKAQMSSGRFPHPPPPGGRGGGSPKISVDWTLDRKISVDDPMGTRVFITNLMVLKHLSIPDKIHNLNLSS